MKFIKPSINSLIIQSVSLSASLLLLPAVAQGQATYTLLIDNFGTPQHVDTGTSNPSSLSLTDAGLFESTGADRELTLFTTLFGSPTGSPGQTFDVDQFSSNRLSLATSSSIVSESTVRYHAIGGGGGFNLESGGGDRFLFDLVSSDQNSNWTLTVTDGNADSASSSFSLGAVGSPTAVEVLFSNFTENGPGTTDFTNVIEYQFTIVGTAIDYEIDRLGVATVVPEPSVAILTILAGTMFLIRRSDREVLAGD